MGSAKTVDGGILLGGFGREMSEDYTYRFKAIITRLDKFGKLLWSREISSDPGTDMGIGYIREFSDGSIIVVGSFGGGMHVTKLNSIGNVVWMKKFYAKKIDNCDYQALGRFSIAEGPNGGILLAGTMWKCYTSQGLVVFKLDTNGSMQWKYVFSARGNSTFGAGIFYENDKAIVVSRSEGADLDLYNAPSVEFSRLNYQTGQLEEVKAWRDIGNYPDNFVSGYSAKINATRLENGNYCLLGQVFGDYLQMDNQPHFKVLEFDRDFNFLKGYFIYSSAKANEYESLINMNSKGEVVYSMTSIEGFGKRKYIGTVQQGTITSQRTRDISNLMIFYDNFEVNSDGSFSYIHNLSDLNETQYFLDYSLLHISDTGSLCLGEKGDFSNIVSATMLLSNMKWLDINPDPLDISNLDTYISVPKSMTEKDICYEVPHCDTLKIHGEVYSCNLDEIFTLSVFKNKECGSIPKWTMDESVLSMNSTLNDTTLQIRFAKPWKGWLYAEINTSCGLLKDSIFLSMLATPEKPDLGIDTSLCAGNSILLKVPPGYVKYEWSDGSVDSSLRVSQPGTYFVQAQNACGLIESDTILISDRKSIPVDLGPDRIICENDTAHLKVDAGFLQYHWNPGNEIEYLTENEVVVSPGINTTYTIEVETSPGCISYDSIFFNVRPVNPIYLGRDTSFCEGDSLQLDAGPGFTKYTWNTGEEDQIIFIQKGGSYYVTASSMDGCLSKDSILINSPWSRPIPTIIADRNLCEGVEVILSAGNFASYEWQDQSINAMLKVNKPGIYTVQVKDINNCLGTDSIIIDRVYSNPTNFLPPDTSICSYETLQISARVNFKSYTWSSFEQGPTSRISKPGIYWLEVENEYGCVGRDSIQVKPKDCLEGLHVPNAFTPNQDGRNDLFKPIIGGKVAQYQFMIYNRWGQIIYSTNDPASGWDGYYKGILQPSNNYVWTLRYQFEDGEIKFLKGTVMLIR